MSFLLLINSVLLSQAASSPSYRVQVPARTVLAVRGWPLVIGCTFPPANSPPALPGNLVITWQRLENNQVVHSFYYGQDQMNYQSQDYQNRTTLFNSQISSGNASLRLTDVRLQDAGRYLCSVSDSRGMDKAEVQVQYAAYYSEPRLTIEVSATSVSVEYEMEGYPEPELLWQGPQGQKLTYDTEINKSEELIHVKTRYVTSRTNSISLTFSLTNQPTSQVMQKSVSFRNGGSPPNAVKDRIVVLTALTTLLSLL